jgi:prophage regulatory protein
MYNNTNQQPKLPTLLRWSQLEPKIGLSRSRVHALIAKGEFPRPIKLGERASAWVESEVLAWLEDRIKQSRPELNF